MLTAAVAYLTALLVLGVPLLAVLRAGAIQDEQTGRWDW